MTTLIQQRGDNDCVLASIAMAAGLNAWGDIWTNEDLESVVKSQGVSDLEPWLNRVGFIRGRDFYEIYTYHEARIAKAFLWKRKALISTDSLNNEHGSHMVYWDGRRIWDPQDGREGKLYHRILTGINPTRVYLLDK